MDGPARKIEPRASPSLRHGVAVGHRDGGPSTEDSGVYKPAPEVYDLSVHALGIAREDCLHVAGSANDVIGAKSAGAACYWNNRTGDRVLVPEFAADAEGPDLRGVLDLV